MSVKVSTWAWKQKIKPTQKLVLLALSDHSNDEDYTCWPSLTHLAEKTCFSRRTVISVINQLVESRHVTRVGKCKYGTTKYRVNFDKGGQELHRCGKDTGAGDTSTVVNELHITDARVSHGTVIEPSINHHIYTSKKSIEEDFDLAEHMFKKICQLNSGMKPPKFDKWANTIRLMREKEKRTHSEIKELFCWANADSFWKVNILSPDKLRLRWDQLTIQKNAKKQSSFQSQSLTDDEILYEAKHLGLSLRDGETWGELKVRTLRARQQNVEASD